MTKLTFQNVRWLNQFKSIPIVSFEQFLKKVFSKTFSKKDFANQYQLNPKFLIYYKVAIGERSTAKQILEHYADEPDWGMDQNLALHDYQKWMGGTQGPTSRAFRHMYFKAWALKAPLRTFHIPPGEMGEALKRAQVFYNLAELAYEANVPYWAFRFLAWSLHYIQDIGQPFHTSQLLTPNFVSFKDIFNLNKAIQRTTQIISNYHWMYEKYVGYRLGSKTDTRLREAMIGTDVRHSSSALLLAKHMSDFSNRFSYEIGEACFAFFGKKFLDPAVDVPNSKPGAYPVADYDKTENITAKQKKAFLKSTEKNLNKTATYGRSLLDLAREEFLK